MKKKIIYLKWFMYSLLFIIILLWLDYFFAAIYENHIHQFISKNIAMQFLDRVAGFANGLFVFNSTLFGEDFYLLTFYSVILFFESFFIMTIIGKMIIEKKLPRKDIFIIIISILCFYILFNFLKETSILFVPGI